MKKSKCILPWLISLFSVVCGYAQKLQVNALDSLAGNFVKYLRKSPGEKILLNTDKWFYLSGETIWFKAYTLNALSNKISVQSKILFVDLVDEQDEVIHQVLMNIPQSRLEGRITIPISTPEGYYWLRAYTRKILDEDSSKIFVQPIYVLNPRKPDSSIASQISQTTKRGSDKDGPPIVSFYPEGGALISGITSVVAFRSVDKSGKPVDITGYVTDGRDTVLRDFKTSLPGMGRFNLDTWKSRKYIAHVKWKDKQFEYPLPLINQYASRLSVFAQNENTFQVRVSLGDSLYHKNKVHSVIAVSRDSLCFAATGTDMYEIWVPKSTFPKGMATLLLFNDQNKVVSERNIYIDKDNHIVSITTDKNQYGPREKARFELSVTDSLQHPVRALCSIAITDDNMDKQSGLESPASNYIFTSLDLPQSASSYSTEELDLIMLTQKEKFSDWTYQPDPVQVPTKSYLEDSTVEFIQGSILNNKDEPVPEQVVTLFSTQKNIIFLSETTDQGGRFRFRLPAGIADSSAMNLQVANQKGTKQDRKIVVDPPAVPHPKTPRMLRKRFDASRQIFLRDFKATQMDTTKFGKGKEWLKEVTVIAAKKKQLNYDEKKRISQFSFIITSDKFDRGGINSLGMALLMAPGIHLKQGYVSIRGGTFGSPASGEPLVVVDGIPIIFDSSSVGNLEENSKVMGYLSSINPSTVDFIEVLAGPEAAIYGARGGNGVISINTTPRVKYDEAYALRGLKRIYTSGFEQPAYFTVPDYANKDAKKSTFPDRRSTIYWNPNLLTNENGKASGEFYTADPATTYTCTVTGITEHGGVIFKQVKIERK